MNDLINKMNNFDFFYCMSDSNDVYRKGMSNESDIKRELAKLSDSQLIELSSNLSEKAIKYFNIEIPTPPTNETKSIDRKEIMSTAWAYLGSGVYNTMSDALKASWKRYKLISSLRSGVTSFAYKNANGEDREAKGTLDNRLFDYEYKGVRRQPNKEIIKYYDLIINDWRSCRIDRLTAA